MPADAPLELAAEAGAPGRTILRYVSEPGIRLESLYAATEGAKRTVVLLDDVEPRQTISGDLARQFAAAGWNLLVPELRATGRTAVAGDSI